MPIQLFSVNFSKIWECNFACQAQYLVRLQGDACRSAHCKWRFICGADQSWHSFCVAGAVFGEVGGWCVSYASRINHDIHFAWQVQRLVKFLCHFSWQVQHLVKLMCHFSWQAQHLVKFMCHFSWQAQHSVEFMRHFSWQALHLVKFMCHFSWQAQHVVKFGMIAGADSNLLLHANPLRHADIPVFVMELLFLLFFTNHCWNVEEVELHLHLLLYYMFCVAKLFDWKSTVTTRRFLV